MRDSIDWVRTFARAIGFGCLGALACVAAAQDVPKYKVDASWPKQLPNKWMIGQVSGMAVDKHDRIWVLQRPRTLTPDEAWAAQKPPRADCCVPAPSVLVFDVAGNLIKSWGGPGHVPDWPVSEHGIHVDASDNVWLAGAGEGDIVLKFDNDGKFLMKIGERPAGKQVQNNQSAQPGRIAGMEVDEPAREIYLADGYLNRRVAVYDADTGAFKRGWGAYGIPLSEIDNNTPPPYDPAVISKQFTNPVHCAHISNEGYVYVCDRGGNRIQVFTKQGSFIKEFFVDRSIRERGSAGTLHFSRDPQQKFLVVGDIMNNVMWILQRGDGKVVGRFGSHGRNAGQFHWLHVATEDSKGNIYTGEVDTGKRIQKFSPEK
jgi:DNA-binding beta-propeller fold protein YncE